MNIQREVIPHNATWTLRPARLLLVTSPNVGWAGLRDTLRRWPTIQIIADTDRTAEALQAARDLRPDGIVNAADLADTSLLDLVQRLGESSPESKIMVFNHEPNRDLEAALRAEGVCSFIVWKDLTPIVLHHCLAAVLEAGVHVVSPAAMRELLTPPAPPEEEIVRLPPLSDEEDMVLDALAEDILEREIPERTPLSHSGATRALASAKDKLRVRTLFGLGLRAGYHKHVTTGKLAPLSGTDEKKSSQN